MADSMDQEKSTEKKKSPEKKPSTEKKSKPSFIEGVKTEFKKITWPDRHSTFKQSIAVVAISVVAGVIIAVLDYVVQYGVNIMTSI